MKIHKTAFLKKIIVSTLVYIFMFFIPKEPEEKGKLRSLSCFGARSLLT